jgi:hypothetical protein
MRKRNLIAPENISDWKEFRIGKSKSLQLWGAERLRVRLFEPRNNVPMEFSCLLDNSLDVSLDFTFQSHERL